MLLWPLWFSWTIFIKHFFDFSKNAEQIFMKLCLHKVLCKVSQVCSNQDCLTYFRQLMLLSFSVVASPNAEADITAVKTLVASPGSCIAIIYPMSYYMSLCNITYLTSFKSLNGFASNFLWVFLGWVPTKIVKIGMQPLFSMESLVILSIFGNS